jgi:hypothetical protein
MPPPERFQPLVPAIGFVLLACMTGLYATGSDLYGRILAYWTFIPWKYPFIDLAVIPSWTRCWRRHGNLVFTDEAWISCGLGPMNYSPLWLHLPVFPTDPAWTNWLGLSLLSAFLLSLGLLPLSRSPGDRALTVLATFSCLPVFAMERGNVDLIIFLLAIGAALCLGGTLGRRILGYGLMLLGGLLKFYPLVLLVLMLRERLQVFAALTLAATAIVAGTAFVLFDELRRMTPVPGGAPFHNLWGARNLTTGFPTVLRAFLEAAGLPAPMVETLAQPQFVSVILTSLLLATTLVLALRFARRDDLRVALTEIPGLTHRLLLIGGALVAGCFFAGQNVGYRGVFLLLILPGILALTHAVRPIFTLTIAAMLCVLWELTTRHILADLFGGSYYPVEGSLLLYTVWVIQELSWWWLVTVLLAILICFAAGSPAWRDLRGRATPVVCVEAE